MESIDNVHMENEMNLGTQTGSLVNHLQSRAVIGQPEPAIGMGVTFLSWTDREPGTIVNVFKIGKTQYIECTDDDYKRIDSNGISESQKYEYTTNPDGYRSTFRIGRSGKWESVSKNENGRYVKTGGYGLRIGQREKYHDFSF